MAIVQEQDYVFCKSATYIGVEGIGKGCLIGTQKLILGLPESIDSAVWNRYFQTTTYSIDGMPPWQVLQTVAESESTVLEGFEDVLTSLGESFQGAVFVDLEQQKRLKVRSGWLTKGIYWSSNERGPGWQGYGLGKKAVADQWVAFYRGHPIAV